MTVKGSSKGKLFFYCRTYTSCNTKTREEIEEEKYDTFAENS